MPDCGSIRDMMVDPGKLISLKTDISKFKSGSPEYKKSKWLSSEGKEREKFTVDYIKSREIRIHGKQEFTDLLFVIYTVMCNGWKAPAIG